MRLPPDLPCPPSWQIVSARRQPIFKSPTRAAISKGLSRHSRWYTAHPATVPPLPRHLSCSRAKLDLGHGVVARRRDHGSSHDEPVQIS